MNWMKMSALARSKAARLAAIRGIEIDEHGVWIGRLFQETLAAYETLVDHILAGGEVLLRDRTGVSSYLELSLGSKEEGADCGG
ncbi:MAG: hypothetical protein JRD89_02435 [Deltaproteobacteria bacterium]|nr:hypothetical protein [Deltaproteobacteria bacterium]